MRMLGTNMVPRVAAGDQGLYDTFNISYHSLFAFKHGLHAESLRSYVASNFVQEKCLAFLSNSPDYLLALLSYPHLRRVYPLYHIPRRSVAYCLIRTRPYCSPRHRDTSSPRFTYHHLPSCPFSSKRAIIPEVPNTSHLSVRGNVNMGSSQEREVFQDKRSY